MAAKKKTTTKSKSSTVKAKSKGAKGAKAAKGAKGAKAAAKGGAKKAAADSVSSISVNVGHVFALRPRVQTSFKPGDFNTAKHFFREESYAKIEDAARAVAEKALELTHEGPGGKPGKRKRH